ncbi:suppressor of fused domain protein [Nonomuraea sp. KC401]|uniref:Suppressor of fused-like domain-containing protein n=1 Tax=Nonomuraea longispora TaxID=1848320 RepID=A0A4R4N8Y9_9ACTN|nr:MULTISPECIES: suppressor of fused domain protein [Nonomuraea]NBE95312.1 hypothetical protein [Nonomuraea sp. K271]TDC05369.1 hypothetical protein E1267_19855 [Nonomuraea longispora]TLF72407.1 suppressor of fused domain protein [Nonomuraea sp. KC401]
MEAGSVDAYLARLGEWAGAEPESMLITPDEVSPPVRAFAYRGQFGEDTISGFTFGLSSVAHPDWEFGRPELFISMNSPRPDWVFAAGFVAAHYRGEKRFAAGDAFVLDAPISPEESDMSALLAFLVTDLDPEFTHLELPDRTINLIQLYPLHASEIPLLEAEGGAALLSATDVDFHDPARPPLSGPARR